MVKFLLPPAPIPHPISCMNLVFLYLSLGWAHAWHFDESPFSTTIMLQTAQDGGHFEHTLPIRGGRGGGNKNNKIVSAFFWQTVMDQSFALIIEKVLTYLLRGFLPISYCAHLLLK